MVSIEVSGATEASAILGELSRGAQRRASLVVRKAATDMMSSAIWLAPVDTGNLVNSISASFSDGGLTAEIAPTAEYAHYVEFGTSRQAPRSFMGPAFDQHLPVFIDAMEQVGTDG